MQNQPHGIVIFKYLACCIQVDVVGLFQYFDKFQGHNTTLVGEFAKTFNEETASVINTTFSILEETLERITRLE